MKGLPEGSAESGTERVFYESMKEIYLKYIDRNQAPLEINIPSKMRHRIADAFDGDESAKSVKDIMLLMEKAVQNIVYLLTEAAIRFSLEKNDTCSETGRV